MRDIRREREEQYEQKLAKIQAWAETFDAFEEKFIAFGDKLFPEKQAFGERIDVESLRQCAKNILERCEAIRDGAGSPAALSVHDRKYIADQAQGVVSALVLCSE